MKKLFGYFIVVAALATFLCSDMGIALAASAAGPGALQQTPRMRRERRTLRRVNRREHRLNRRESRIRLRLRHQRNRRWRRHHRVG